jgi:electron transport complex protein RnfB
MPEDEADVYRRLQQHLDRMPVGFPATASGVELRLLRRLFTPEEAELALLLSAVPEPVGRIARRSGGRSADELARRLETMADKGLILAGGRGARRRFGKAPLAVGIYEMQVDRLTRELQQDFEQYAREAFGREFLGRRTTQMRTIPVNASFVPERQVGRYDDGRALLGSAEGPFAVLNCVCRQGQDLVGAPCRQTARRRVCLVIGAIARKAVELGSAQVVSREQALEMLERAERDGMVLQPSNTREPAFICFCCGCCCGVLKMAKQMPRPAEYLHSNYQAAVDAELCAECGTCEGRCPMEALHCGDGATRVDLDRCIGCGLCASTCSTGAMRLHPRPAQAVPPKSLGSLYTRITLERYGVVGTAAIVGRALVGRRI